MAMTVLFTVCPRLLMQGEIVIRPVMYLALTYDHRLIDGREAVTFLCGVRDKVLRFLKLSRWVVSC